MAAKSSVVKERVPRSPVGHISVMNTATPIDSGTAMTSESSEDTIVPYMNGSAPY